MSDRDLQRILSRVGSKVGYRYPGNGVRRVGLLKDRTGIKEPNRKNEVPYWVVVDLIDFPDQRERDFMRFGYYRQSSSSWGSQTTLTMSLSNWKRLLVRAAREKEWFRKLLEDVTSEIEKNPNSY